jgi:hypothetical protein
MDTAMEELDPGVYEQLCLSLYAYQFGTITFLELLDQFEEILHVQTPQTDNQDDAA